VPGVEREAVRLRVPFDVLDLSTVGEFRRWAMGRIRDEVPTDSGSAVVFGLEDVEYVMAAGVQALLDVEAVLAARGQTLLVAAPAPIVTRVLEICGVTERWVVT